MPNGRLRNICGRSRAVESRNASGMILNNLAHCTEDFCNISAPCTRIITIPLIGWTPA